MIKAKNIKKKYGSLEVLKGVDFEINQGDLVSIVGASGAGKTTFLQIIGTLDQSDSGNLFINNKKVDSSWSDKEISQFRNKEIGFVFQFHNLLPEFSAVENIMIPAMIYENQNSELERRALELLDLLGIKERANHKPSELSGGEQQRVAIARALINKPSIILADEPTGNLDSNTAEEINQLFVKLSHELNQTVVIVTHNQKLADLTDKKFVMKDGKIIN